MATINHIHSRIEKADHLYLNKESRIIQKFNKQQDLWSKVIRKTTAKLHREFDNSIYFVSESFRAKMETQRALDIIEPDVKR